jgi:hypothetical protein
VSDAARSESGLPIAPVYGAGALDGSGASPKSQMLRFHTQTAGVQLTGQQPEVNLVRVARQALGAVLGGAQSLHRRSDRPTNATQGGGRRA